MNTNDCNKVRWSFEVFPPKRTSKVSTIYSTLADLKKLGPDFISVTYGAGGSSNCQATVEIVNAVKNHYDIDSVAHLPCIALTKADVLDQMMRFKAVGINKILALRGDLPADGSVPQGDFKYASELISFVRAQKEFADFSIFAACYPESHPNSKSWQDDISFLKAKVDAGVDGLISQLFFSNDLFYTFLDRARNAGISVPIEAGIMPVINARQIERMVSLCKASLPDKFVRVMDKFKDNPDAMFEIGCAYAVDQIIDLVAHGVDGIHLYTMNNPRLAARIYESVKSVLGR